MSTVSIDSLSNPTTSFTPSLSFGGAAVGMTYGTRNGLYVKIGTLVFFECNFVLTAKGSSTGTAAIGGLPFTVGSISAGASVGFVDALSSVSGGIAALCVTTTTNINVYQTVTGTIAQLTQANFTNTSQMYITGVYST